MPHANGKITPPISTEDVRVTLGENSHDVATLCSSTKINPAAKYKPIRYPNKVTPLGPVEDGLDERIGSIGDVNNGIYYGLKIGINANYHWTDLHDANYEYLQIRPGTDWSRLTDFNGYDQNAKFNPNGEVPTEAIKDMGCSIRIDYDSTVGDNGTGVDIAVLMPKLTSDVAFTLANCYPCVLASLTKNNATRHYVRALWNKRYGEQSMSTDYRGFTKLKDADAWWYDWKIILDGYPNLDPGDELKISVFFMYDTRSVNSTDCRNWVQVTASNVANSGIFTCPNAVAKMVTVKSARPKAIEVKSITLRPNICNITFQKMSGVEAPTAGMYYKIEIRASQSNGALVSGSIFVVGSAMSDGLATDSFTTTYIPSGNPSFEGSWSVIEYPNGPNGLPGATVNSGSANVLVVS